MSSATLWSGPFGLAYTDRNADAGAGRGPFWHDLLSAYPVVSALEIGANMGPNIRHIREDVRHVAACDVNERAMDILALRYPDVETNVARAAALPYLDGVFELVVSCGVLIHQAPNELAGALDEMYRVSSKYLLAIEYRSDAEREVEYRGLRGALWTRPYDRIVPGRLPVVEIARGPLGPPGWEDQREWWLWKLA